MNSPEPPSVLIVSGPSGSGKSTLVQKILELPGTMLAVSCTTRAPRVTEKQGKWYNFVSEAEFQQMVARGEFLEYAQVFGKNWYGTPRKWLDEAREQDKDLVLEIDVQGALQVKEKTARRGGDFRGAAFARGSRTPHPRARPGFRRRNSPAAGAGAPGNDATTAATISSSSTTISSAPDGKCRPSCWAGAAASSAAEDKILEILKSFGG